MYIITLSILAAVSAAAIWRVLTLSRRLSDLNSLLSAAEIDKAKALEALQQLRQSSAEASMRDSSLINSLGEQLDERNDTIITLRENNATLSTTVDHLRDRLIELEQHYETERLKREEQIKNDREEHDRMLEAQMRDLASTILRQNSSELRASHEEKLREILTPLRENLDSFRKTVSDTYSSEARERFSLTEKIRELVNLNNTISRETRELTQALRGNTRVQGDWGEMILEGILERSGLREGEEYFLQVTDDGMGNSLTDDQGTRLRPDVVVRYPDGRCVVIDSKVSLTAFIDWADAAS